MRPKDLIRRTPVIHFEGLEARQHFSITSAATDAYIYGLAPVLANISEQIATHVPSANPATAQAPINQFANVPTFPPAGSGLIVRPNADTLYSTAWLDLSKGPVVLQTPATGGAFDLFQFLDAYTNTFGGIGTRTTGNGAQAVLIAGPTWSGQVPSGLTLIKAPTNTVWIIGRIAAQNGVNSSGVDVPNYAPVNALQAQLSLTPLANYTPGGTYTPPTNVPVTALSPGLNPAATADQNVLGLSAQQYFTLLSQVLKTNPPPAADSAIISELANFNLAPGQHFNWSTLTTAQQSALSAGYLLGEQRLGADGKANVGVTEVTATNWTERLQDGQIGDYGTNYDARAVIAYGGLGANLPEDAIYPSTGVDSNGAPLTGANNYVLHFAANQLPPASAFWSLTVYNSAGYFVSNPINRYSIGSLHSSLHTNADGSLDIYLQNTDPGGTKTGNWLPTPTGAFNLSLRLYDPTPAALNGTWVPPAVVSAQQIALNNAAVNAYTYLYPLVNQYYTEQVQTDATVPNGDLSVAPANQLFNNSLAPLYNNTGPNADTLYTGGWLDLTGGPVILHVPDFTQVVNGNTVNRYYSFELADAWTNTFAVLGTPTTGDSAGDYVIVPPNWTGTLPAGVTQIQSPTNLVTLLGRTLVYGNSDLNTADSYRQQFSLTPLAGNTALTTPALPSIDSVTPISQQIAQLSGAQFFSLAAQLLQTNPQLPADSTTAAPTWLSQISLTPGSFNASTLSVGQLAAVKQAPSAATPQIGADAYAFETSGPRYGFWGGLPSDVAGYGTNYADRAGAAITGAFVLTNPPAEALYLSAVTDSHGNYLVGTNDYELTFPAGSLPPAQYFWSITLYQPNGELYPNSYNLYEIGNRSTGLGGPSTYQLNNDGSLTIYLGNTPPPTDLQSNWIPAPNGPFILTLRIYGPEAAVVSGGWTPPPVINTSYAAAVVTTLPGNAAAILSDSPVTAASSLDATSSNVLQN